MINYLITSLLFPSQKCTSTLQHCVSVTFQRGRSFINSVLAVEGVSKSDAFFKESIKVTCNKGILTPSIFEDDKWCACKYIALVLSL